MLRYAPASPEVMAAQLGYLLKAAEMPEMSLGVIPFTAVGRQVWPLEAFTIFDDARVHVELLSAQVTVTSPSEIILYMRAFERLGGLAVYGPACRGSHHRRDQRARLIASQLRATPFTCPGHPELASGNHVGTRCRERDKCRWTWGQALPIPAR